MTERVKLNLTLDMSRERKGRLDDAIDTEDLDAVARIIADVFAGTDEIDVTTSTKRKGTLRRARPQLPLWSSRPNDASQN